MDKHKTIIMLGPSPSEKGGMGSVETLILNIASREFTIKHITTWNGQVSRFTKLSTATVFIKAFLAFLWKLLKGEVDLVHLHVSERGSVVRKSLIALVCMVTGKPFILHAHGCEFHEFYEKLPRGVQQLITSVFRRSAYLIALSDSWRNYYIDTCHLAPEQVVVLNNPVALPEHWQKTASAGRLRFVFLGKINKRKGIFDLLAAFANLEPIYRNQVELVLAGNWGS
ncbi:MAG: glycosyltransferase [Planktothrix sp. GU0601_MAG3]|nr:MAG: glycosyltransferase [Planktothrix sp. GU0601_MAG3]